METVLFFLCIILMLAYLLWFVFGINRWSKELSLVIDCILILLCVGTLVFMFVSKDKEQFGESMIETEKSEEGSLHIPVITIPQKENTFEENGVPVSTDNTEAVNDENMKEEENNIDIKTELSTEETTIPTMMPENVETIETQENIKSEEKQEPATMMSVTDENIQEEEMVPITDIAGENISEESVNDMKEEMIENSVEPEEENLLEMQEKNTMEETSEVVAEEIITEGAMPEMSTENVGE